MKVLTKEVYSLSKLISLSSIQISHHRLLYCVRLQSLFIHSKPDRNYFVFYQVRLETNIFHPNINIDGKVCLRLLNPQNWIPSTKIIESIYTLYVLFVFNTSKYCCFAQFWRQSVAC
jgi:hypothetical protein